MGASDLRYPLRLEVSLEQVCPQPNQVALGLRREGRPELG